MDLFTRFNRKNIDDRQIDTLIGISKGLIADGKVNQAEAEFLMNWLAQSRQASDNPIILNLLEKVSSMLEDGILDADESSELLSILRKVTGESPNTIDHFHSTEHIGRIPATRHAGKLLLLSQSQ